MAKPLDPPPVDNAPADAKAIPEEKRAYMTLDVWTRLRAWLGLLQQLLKGITNDGATITISENVTVNGNETITGSLNGLPSTPDMANRHGQDSLMWSGGTGWTPYTPTLTAQTGTYTTASAAGWFKVVDNVVFLHIEISIVSVGTGTRPVVGKPFSALAGIYNNMIGNEELVSGFVICGRSSGANTPYLVTNYDGSSPVGNNTLLTLSGFYIKA